MSALNPELSVVVPVMNEAENIAPLVREIVAALDGKAAFEIIYVDDGSTDDSFARLRALKAEIPMLRALRHAQRKGQSAAVRTGVKAARAAVIATLDGDGQNDPADIPSLLAAYRGHDAKTPLMLAGHRTTRRDSWIKRVSSKLANGYRAGKLKDNTPDTGCGLKLFPRDVFLDFPAFNHMHRFLPALMIRAGGIVRSVPVAHRPRARGSSKYGTIDRLIVGIADVKGVSWLIERSIAAEVAEDI